MNQATGDFSRRGFVGLGVLAVATLLLNWEGLRKREAAATDTGHSSGRALRRRSRYFGSTRTAATTSRRVRSWSRRTSIISRAGWSGARLHGRGATGNGEPLLSGQDNRLRHHGWRVLGRSQTRNAERSPILTDPLPWQFGPTNQVHDFHPLIGDAGPLLGGASAFGRLDVEQ